MWMETLAALETKLTTARLAKEAAEHAARGARSELDLCSSCDTNVMVEELRALAARALVQATHGGTSAGAKTAMHEESATHHVRTE